MTIPAPFSSGFPLNGSPFNSKLQDQMDLAKNYFVVAFKPGYPLQAKELNELQEVFYAQQTLTQRLFANWHRYDYIQQGGTPMTATPWNGCTPVDPATVIKQTSGGSVSVVADPGWYLMNSSSIFGGFGVWVYNPTAVTVLTGFNSGTATKAGTYGIVIKQNTVNCTTSDPAGVNEDRSLQDSSNLNVINGPCGAARIQASVVRFAKQGDTLGTGEVFLPIFTAALVSGTPVIKYVNNYTIT